MQELQAVDCVRPMWKPCEYVSTVMLYVDELINLCQTHSHNREACAVFCALDSIKSGENLLILSLKFQFIWI